MLTEEQKFRLNPEQLAIAEKWEADRDYRLACCDRMSAAEKVKDTEAYKQALDDYMNLNKDEDFCAHERSIWSNCAGCEEITRLLNPEMYCSKCEESLMENDEPPLVQGMCDFCSQAEDD